MGHPIVDSREREKTDLWWGFAPTILPHVRWCEHGHPVRVGVSERVDYEDTFAADLMGQGETEQIAAGRYGYELGAVYGVAHGRGVQGLPGIEVP